MLVTISELELVPIRNPRIAVILTGVNGPLEKGGGTESFQVASPVFVRTSGIIDFAVSGFEPTSVSPMNSSTTQTVSPLVLGARSLDGLPCGTTGERPPAAKSLWIGGDVGGEMCPVRHGA